MMQASQGERVSDDKDSNLKRKWRQVQLWSILLLLVMLLSFVMFTPP